LPIAKMQTYFLSLSARSKVIVLAELYQSQNDSFKFQHLRTESQNNITAHVT